MKYNPRPFERLLDAFIARQANRIVKLIDSIYDQITFQTFRFTGGRKDDFRFGDYPALSNIVDKILAQMINSITSEVVSGIEWSWDLADAKNDDMVDSLAAKLGKDIPKSALSRWHAKNMAALSAYIERKTKGINLSQRVWNFGGRNKAELEMALGLGLGEGKSAGELAREVKQYLKFPDKLFRRVRDKESGWLRLSRNAAAFHPGQGVYRSSYKNALRLAATENNIAYRRSDFNRVQDMDFVLGIEVHLSDNHTVMLPNGKRVSLYDICDELQGIYPKDFVFEGWHPNCRCYTTTILPSREEFMKYLDGMDENGHSTYQFKDVVPPGQVPPQLQEWLDANRYRVMNAKSLPYFIEHNKEMIDKALAGNPDEDVPPVGSDTGNVEPPASKEPEKDAETIYNETTEEWRVLGADDYEEFSKSTASKFDFLGFKKEVEEIFETPMNGRISIHDDDSWSMFVKGDGFRLNRYFYIDHSSGRKGILTCEHEYFELDPSLQGKGLSKKLFRALDEQYKNMGVQKLEVHANIDVGGYTWARYGFSAARRSIAESAVGLYSGKYPDLYKRAMETIDKYYSGKNLSDDRPFPMNLLTPWGKQLLLGSDWNGVLDFRDKTQRAIWDNYLKG